VSYLEGRRDMVALSIHRLFVAITLLDVKIDLEIVWYHVKEGEKQIVIDIVMN
jgi:hypothetical protein